MQDVMVWGMNMREVAQVAITVLPVTIGTIFGMYWKLKTTIAEAKARLDATIAEGNRQWAETNARIDTTIAEGNARIDKTIADGNAANAATNARLDATIAAGNARADALWQELIALKRAEQGGK